MLIYLNLGSNIGKRELYLEKALELLNQNEVSITKRSSIYETEPIGSKTKNWFLNLCVQAKTSLEPLKLLALCKNIEKKVGRKKRDKWDQREIDIDILFYGDKIITEKSLMLPHSQIIYRNFVLIPLKEIAPDLIHPIQKKTVTELTLNHKATGEVKKYARSP